MMVNLNVLWLTSMSSSLYKIYGKDFIESFRKHHPNSKLLITVDKDIPNSNKRISSENMIVVDLTDIRLLKKFIKKNKENIPIDEGGIISRTELIKKNKFNNRWFGWYKKVLTLFLAVDLYQYHQNFDIFVWIDCDCIIKSQVSNLYLQQQLNNKSLSYFYGPIRKKETGIESGLLFFDIRKNKKGVEIIKKWHDLYWSKEYLSYPRWDDGYLLKILLLDKDKKLFSKHITDLGLKSTSQDSHVMTGCDIWSKIIHQKGSI